MINQGKIVCPNCKKFIIWDSKFCNYCGIRIKREVETKIEKKKFECPYCQKYIDIDSRFCEFCGEKIDIVPETSEEIVEKYKHIENKIEFIDSVDEGLFIHCPICNSTFQEKEFLDYLDNINRCPVCGTHMDFWEFKSYLVIGDREKGSGAKFLNEYEKDVSKICYRCNNLVPIFSKYCIFCGLII